MMEFFTSPSSAAMQVEFVALALLFYSHFSKGFFVKVREVLGITKDGFLLRKFMLLHNFALCIFSGWVTLNTWPLLVGYIQENGYQKLFVDPQFWEKFEYWAIVFYVSKYYEFIDSWILVLKGDNPSYLQVYHHFGVVVAMWLACKNHCNWLVFMVVLNSFIHTLMYFYYCFSTQGYKSPLAKYLTNMQLLQFVTGILASSPTLVLETTLENKLSMVFMDIYAIGLIFLFHEMALKKYKDKKGEKNVKDE